MAEMGGKKSAFKETCAFCCGYFLHVPSGAIGTMDWVWLGCVEGNWLIPLLQSRALEGYGKALLQVLLVGGVGE